MEFQEGSFSHGNPSPSFKRNLDKCSQCQWRVSSGSLWLCLAWPGLEKMLRFSSLQPGLQPTVAGGRAHQAVAARARVIDSEFPPGTRGATLALARGPHPQLSHCVVVNKGQICRHSAGRKMWVQVEMIITSLEWETLCCPPTQSVQPALPLTISKESVVEAVYNGLAVTMGEGLKGGPGLLMGGGEGGGESCTSSWSERGLGRNAGGLTRDSGLGIEYYTLSMFPVTLSRSSHSLLTLMECAPRAEVTRNLGITVP